MTKPKEFQTTQDKSQGYKSHILKYVRGKEGNANVVIEFQQIESD